MERVSKVILFAASACPMGRTMGSVVREIGERHSELSVVTYYIDIHIEETNRYRIKQNPTTLFVSRDDEELYRVEGFKETEAMTAILDGIHSGQLSIAETHEKNQGIVETYVIYLYQDDALVPLEVEHSNLTSVKTPRITLIQLLLKAKAEGLSNPFPSSAALVLVEFKGKKGTVTLKGIQESKGEQLQKMQRALKKSLEAFGIEEVEIIPSI